MAFFTNECEKEEQRYSRVDRDLPFFLLCFPCCASSCGFCSTALSHICALSCSPPKSSLLPAFCPPKANAWANNNRAKVVIMWLLPYPQPQPDFECSLTDFFGSQPTHTGTPGLARTPPQSPRSCEAVVHSSYSCLMAFSSLPKNTVLFNLQHPKGKLLQHASPTPPKTTPGPPPAYTRPSPVVGPSAGASLHLPRVASPSPCSSAFSRA